MRCSAPRSSTTGLTEFARRRSGWRRMGFPFGYRNSPLARSEVFREAGDAGRAEDLEAFELVWRAAFGVAGGLDRRSRVAGGFDRCDYGFVELSRWIAEVRHGNAVLALQDLTRARDFFFQLFGLERRQVEVVDRVGGQLPAGCDHRFDVAGVEVGAFGLEVQQAGPAVPAKLGQRVGELRPV